MQRCSLTAETRHWVFDLDDTLYAERDYVRSALTYVGAYAEERFGVRGLASLLVSLNEAGTHDSISVAWERFALPESERTLAVTAMRAHQPDITLSKGAHSVLRHLRQCARPYAIVTDGRSITQRAKISALGCDDAKLISISEETGLSKLDPARFCAIATEFPQGRFVYVGDNPRKDFVAPNQLGWETIMLNHNGRGVHAQELPANPAYHPTRIVSDMSDLLPGL